MTLMKLYFFKNMCRREVTPSCTYRCIFSKVVRELKNSNYVFFMTTLSTSKATFIKNIRFGGEFFS